MALETAEQIVEAFEGEWGEEWQQYAVDAALEGEWGGDLREIAIVRAINGSYGEDYVQDGLELAQETGLADRWAAEDWADPDERGEEEIGEDQIREAEERMTALVSAERERVEKRFGELSDREYAALGDAVPEGAFDGGDFPDMVQLFGPQLEKMRDRSSEEGRLEAGVARARELVAERETEEADGAGRSLVEQRLHGDDPEPEEGSEEDRIERAVQVAWAMRADPDELDRAASELPAPDVGGEEDE